MLPSGVRNWAELHGYERFNQKYTKQAEHLVLSEISYLPLLVLLVFNNSFLSLKASGDILELNS